MDPNLGAPGEEPEVPGGCVRSSAPAPSYVGGDDLLGVTPCGGGGRPGRGRVAGDPGRGARLVLQVATVGTHGKLH